MPAIAINNELRLEFPDGFRVLDAQERDESIATIGEILASASWR